MKVVRRFSFFIALSVASASGIALAAKAPLIGVIDLDGVDTTAGCFFNLVGDKESNYVFVESNGTWMSINGKRIQFPVNEKNTWPKTKGEKSTLDYRSGGVKTILEITKTSQCEEGEECGGESYEGTISVQDGRRRETKNISGGCGE